MHHSWDPEKGYCYFPLSGSAVCTTLQHAVYQQSMQKHVLCLAETDDPA